MDIQTAIADRVFDLQDDDRVDALLSEYSDVARYDERGELLVSYSPEDGERLQSLHAALGRLR